MKNALTENIRLSLSIFTRLPIPEVKMEKASWQLSLAISPICGYVLVLISVVPLLLAVQIGITFSPILQAVCTTVLLTFLTGAMHLDGFADICDGFGCHAEKEKRLEIMHDPRVGSFGVSGITLILITKTAALYTIFQSHMYYQAMSIIIISRFMMCLAAFVSKPAVQRGLGHQVIGRLNKKHLALSFALTIPFIFSISVLISLTVILASVYMICRKSKILIGGLTGDGLGAICELSETIGFLTIALIVSSSIG